MQNHAIFWRADQVTHIGARNFAVSHTGAGGGPRITAQATLAGQKIKAAGSLRRPDWFNLDLDRVDVGRDWNARAYVRKVDLVAARTIRRVPEFFRRSVPNELVGAAATAPGGGVGLIPGVEVSAGHCRGSPDRQDLRSDIDKDVVRAGHEVDDRVVSVGCGTYAAENELIVAAPSEKDVVSGPAIQGVDIGISEQHVVSAVAV